MKCPHCGNAVLLVKDDGKHLPPFKAVKPQAPRASTDTGDLESLLDAINDDRLEGHLAAADFVAQTRERFAKYKDRTMMTEKQMGWLRKLANPDAEEEWS